MSHDYRTSARPERMDDLIAEIQQEIDMQVLQDLRNLLAVHNGNSQTFIGVSMEISDKTISMFPLKRKFEIRLKSPKWKTEGF